jgi:hypothetical protein
MLLAYSVCLLVFALWPWKPAKRCFAKEMTYEQIREFAALATARTVSGDWLYTYRQLAKRYHVSAARVSKLAFQLQLPCRSASGWRRCEAPKPPTRERGPSKNRIPAHFPPAMAELYRTLCRKTQHYDALKLVEEHMRVRGIMADA